MGASSQGRDRDWLQRRLNELAAQDEVAGPPVRVGGWRQRGAHTGHWRDGRVGITVGGHALRQANDEVLDGVLAHELKHVIFGDPQPPASPVDGAVEILPAAAFFVASLLLTIWLVGSWPLLILAVLSFPVGFVLGRALSVRLLAWLDARHGVCRWHEEVRADLAACRLVGPEAVTAMLRYRLPKGGALRRQGHVFVAALLLDSHPPIPLRLDAAAHYDPADDPDAAAWAWASRGPLWFLRRP